MKYYILAILLAIAPGVFGQHIKVVFYNNCNSAIQDSIIATILTIYDAPIERLTNPLPSKIKRLSGGLDARSIVDHVASHRCDECVRVIGVTDRDLFAYNRDSADVWGVFGYAKLGAGSVIVSTHRVTEYNTVLRISKIILHELGHTYGVPHCTKKGCVMFTGAGYITELDENQLAMCKKCLATMLAWEHD